MQRETRVVPIEGIEVRESPTGEPRGIAGTAAVFNKSTVIAGMFEERIEPGAFDDAVKEADVAGLFNHDPNFVLGRTSSNTMTLTTSDEGLSYDIPELPQSRADVLEAVRRKDVRGNSFSFSIDSDADEEWVDRQEEDKIPLRIIKRVGRLYDVGPVTFPAYEQTMVAARSMEKARALTNGEKDSTEGCANCRDKDQRIAELIQVRDKLYERIT